MLTYNQGAQSSQPYQGYTAPVYPQLPAGQGWDPSQAPTTPAPARGYPFQQQQVAAPPSYGASAPGVPGSSAMGIPGVPQAPGPFSNPQQQAPLTGAWAARAGYSYSSAPTSQLQPQQLESPSKDEDSLYGPLGRARGKIDRALLTDVEISPDLADLLNPSSEPPYVAPPSLTPAFRSAQITRNTPLPDSLHQELNYKHLTARMGLFEEIERAWFSVDNKLFLWDYGDGRDFSRYDEMTDIIQTVGLVRVRKDVFVDDITHLLVICTASKVTLLGVARSDKGALSLYATSLSADAPATMTDIQGTDGGRIFMLGANKDLYELEYSTGGGWLGGGSKAWISNKSSGYISTWVPTVFNPNAGEGIEFFALDAQQGRLFAYRTRGDIEWYDVTGAKFESRARSSNLRNDFIRLGYGGPAPQDGARVVNIAVVGGEESKRAWVVVIAQSGARMYLGGGSAYYPGGIGGSLQVLGHRPPPPETLRADSMSFYSAGTFIAVQSTDDASSASRLTFTTPNSGRQSAMRENFDVYTAPPVLQEWSVAETLPSQVWCMAEVTATDPAYAPASLRRSDGVALSALPRQTTVGPRQIIILATSGVFWATLPRPIDMFEADLELEKDAAVVATRSAFGRSQLCAMAVQMGSEDSKPNFDYVAAATNILLNVDPPSIRTASNSARSIVYSPRHDGYALIIARILRPIWNSKVTAPAGPARLQLGNGDKILLDVQSRLSTLRRYMDEHPFPVHHHTEGEAKLAWEQEALSLDGLNTLVKMAIEAISFILLLADYKLSDVIAKCDTSTQSTLSSLTWQGLLSSQGGRDVARKLVHALIELQIGQELSIDTLSSILQTRCANFVQPGDVVLYKAEESLRRAESTRDAIERSESIAESLSLYFRASSTASNAVFRRLPDASQRYRALQDVRGTIELPLKVATELDRDDKAGDFVRDGRQAGDPRRAFFEQREQCYELVVEALGSYDEGLNKATAAGRPNDAARIRDEAYGIAISSDDELFHYYLYDWIVLIGRTDQLLEFETPFIERYLQITASDVAERRDLLWKYYSRREEYLLASKALSDIATRASDLALQQRVYYLAEALTNARSAASLGSEDVEFTTSLQERIDVAQVQLEIIRAVDGHTDMSPAEKAGPLEQLNGELLGLDDLYQTFARPLRLYEPILLILKTADTRIEDVVEAVWQQLIRTRAGSGAYPDAAVGELVTDLCRKYYPSEAAPGDIVLTLVYGEAAPHRASTAAGWASQALLAGGVGLRDLWDTVVALSDEAGDADAREYFAEEAAALVEAWLDHPEEHGLPAAGVDQFASGYLLRTNGATGDARRQETRKTMQAGKQAAQQF